jgi:hypothetical protein
MEVPGNELGITLENHKDILASALDKLSRASNRKAPNHGQERCKEALPTVK